MINPSKDWINVKFEQIVENITDRIDKPSESGLDSYIGLDQLDTDQIRIKRFGSTSDVEATKFLCKKGDIIFGKRNAYLRKVAVTDRDAVVSAHSMVLRPKGDLIYSDFLPCLLQSSTFWKVAHSISEGSMSPTIKWKTLAKQEFIIPPIEKQQKIAELLWAIENNIEKTENLISINEKLKKGLLNELLTKGIGHKKFKKTEIGEIPEEWNLCKFRDVISINPESLSNNTIPDYEMKYIDISSIEKTGEISNFTKYKFSESPSRARRIVKRNDVIISTVRPYLKGFATIKSDETNLICSTGFAVLRETNRIISGYIYQFCLSNLFEFQSNNAMVGSNYPALNNEDIERFCISLPTIDEQRKIITVLNKFDTYLNNLNDNIIHLSYLKKKLTDELLSGNLRLN